MDRIDRLIQVLEGIEKQLSILNRRLSAKHNDKYYSITDLILAVINEYVGNINVISNKNNKTEEEIMNEILNNTPHYNKNKITKKI